MSFQTEVMDDKKVTKEKASNGDDDLFGDDSELEDSMFDVSYTLVSCTYVRFVSTCEAYNTSNDL